MIEQRVVKTIEKALELPAGAITAETRSADVADWDSLGHLTILMELEAEFPGQVNDNPSVASAISVPEIVAALTGA